MCVFLPCPIPFIVKHSLLMPTGISIAITDCQDEYTNLLPEGGKTRYFKSFDTELFSIHHLLFTTKLIDDFSYLCITFSFF